MQDDKTLQQMIREHEQDMPPEIMKMIADYDWKRELREIVRQEALMLDVGTDLEQSVYLLILGVVNVADVYEQLVDGHEIPDEKAQKVLYEIEERIFKPLYQKLAKLNQDEEDMQKSGGQTIADSSDESRDDILAEIEKDHAQPIGSNIVMPGTGTLPAASMEPVTKKVDAALPNADKSASVSSPVSVTSAVPPKLDRLGLHGTPSAPPAPAPDSASQSGGSPATSNKPAESRSATAPASQAPVQGIQADPIAAGLTKPTITTSPTQMPATPAPAKNYAADPYREPIE